MGLADRDYMRERYRGPINTGYAGDHGRARPQNRKNVRTAMGALLAICSVGYSLWHALGNPDISFWLARDGPAVRFPDSGTVTVSPLAMVPGPKSTFGVEVPPDNANNYVVRLDRPEDGRMVISIYVRSGDQVRVPVPAGNYVVRFSSGKIWHGQNRLFGRASRTERVVAPMAATPSLGAGIKFAPGDLISVQASARKFASNTGDR